MEIDDDRCYEALKSRDARFDGLFFVGVRTTGIYCRPVCSARRPLRKNVNFYRHPAEAEAAGLRPCLKCRPETAPGTPAWKGTATTVTRALRLIAEGLQDDVSVEDLATRLGVTDRHLRRLFNEHLGATPVAVAQLYRVQLAKRLVSDTSLSLTDVAFASGFKSLRRFNAAFKDTYSRAPRELRKQTAASKKMKTDETFSIHLGYRPPYDIDTQFQYLAGRAIPGVEVVADGQYRRVVQFDDTVGTICVEDSSRVNQLLLHVDIVLAGFLPQIVERVRRIFDLYAEPDAIRDVLNGDPVLRKLLKKRPGQRLPGAWCPFELTMRAILGQQISVKGA
ncbi:MAG: DNA-3-methyladenine glycosylase 2 family protein, partial [Candidatus Hydrogenedentota bacterium]